MDKRRRREVLERRIEEALVDAYHEDEEFLGFLYTLENKLRFPLQAHILGEMVEVVGLDERASESRRGVVAVVRKGKRKYRVSLLDLDIDATGTNREWLDAYRLWVSRGG